MNSRQLKAKKPVGGAQLLLSQKATDQFSTPNWTSAVIPYLDFLADLQLHRLKTHIPSPKPPTCRGVSCWRSSLCAARRVFLFVFPPLFSNLVAFLTNLSCGLPWDRFWVDPLSEPWALFSPRATGWSRRLNRGPRRARRRWRPSLRRSDVFCGDCVALRLGCL